MVKKLCKTCKEEKGLHLFYKQKCGLLGRTGSCKACRLNYQKKYDENHRVEKRAHERKYYKKNRQLKLDKYRIWLRENPGYFKYYYKQNRQKKLAIDKRWRDKNPDRIKAYITFRKAILKGKIIKPVRCSMCGECSPKIQGHHSDYTKPLEVIWVCHPCHAHIHKKIRKIKG